MPVGASTSRSAGGDGFLEVALVELADQVGQHLGVGLGLERVPPLLERLPDGAGVLDDAVVDEGDPAALVGVGMGVGGGGGAVRGPAGVADPDGALGASGRFSSCSSTPSLPAALMIFDALAVDDRRCPTES